MRVGFDAVELGLGMKFLTGLLAVVVLLAGIGSSQAEVRIADDRGGRIGTYVDKYQDMRSSANSLFMTGFWASP